MTAYTRFDRRLAGEITQRIMRALKAEFADTNLTIVEKGGRFSDTSYVSRLGIDKVVRAEVVP